MFPASIKSVAAFASSYTRGVQLARKGAVLSCNAYELEEKGSCELDGQVRGSERQPYSTWVKLDLRRQTVVDYDCTCPANANYAGMCKHGVALALAYVEEAGLVAKGSQPSAASAGSAKAPGANAPGAKAPGAKASADSSPEVARARPAEALATGSGALGAGGGASPSQSRSAAGGRSKAGSKAKSKAKAAPAPPPPRPTSRAVTLLMNASAELAQYEAEQSIRAADARPPEGELADISCTIGMTRDPYAYRYYGGVDDVYWLRMRIRRGKASYVVKHVEELMDAWERGSTTVYGKNLTLAHVRPAFTDRAARLLDFISQLERAQRALYRSRAQYRYGGSGTDIKELPLASADAIAVLDIMEGADVTFDLLDTRSRKPRVAKVVRGNPRLACSLEPASDGGWDLRVPQGVAYIRSGDDLYVIDDARAWRCDAGFTRQAGTMIEALFPAGPEPFHIADEDMGVFCERVLPMLEVQEGFSTPDELAEFVPPEAEFSFRIGSIDGFVTCTAAVAYDGVTVPLFEDLAPSHPVRDVSRELEAQGLVREFFPNGYIGTPDYSGKRASVANVLASYGYGGYGAYGEPAREAFGLGPGPGMPWFPEDDVESLYRLLADGVSAFSSLGAVFLSESLSGVNVSQAPEIHVEASVAGSLLDLSVEASGLEPGDLVRYLASYRRKQRYVRLSSGDIVRLGDGVRALSELVDGLGVTDADILGADGSGGTLPVNRTLFVDALMKEAPGVRFDRDDAFRSIVRAFDTIADSDFAEPESLRDVMRGYQRTGFKWLSTLHALGFGGILADDMGLGKTLQVIALLLARKRGADAGGAGAAGGAAGGSAAGGDAASEGLPSLVVCPASLVYNWLAEVERFAPALDAVAVVGPASERKRIIALASAEEGRRADERGESGEPGKSGKAGEPGKAPRPAGAPAESRPDLFITSYDLMKRDIDAYAKAGFDIVVLDEAHYIKNAATQSAKAAKRLPSRVRFALTGTPIENRLSELWSIFDFLMPGILGPHDSFANRFEKPISAGEEGVAERLRSLVAPFILRRLKGDVLTDLPEKSESVVYAVMEGEQDKLYRANAERLALELSHQMPEEFAANRIAILAELTRLRQICCDPHLAYENYGGGSAKLETCMELVSSAVEAGHSVLLFSQFTTMLELIAERMRKAKVGYLMLTGATSKEQRVRLVNEFQSGAVPVFLISLKAGGVGLNLTAADIVIHYDPWWNVSAQNQATDRAHRIGQTRDVSVFKLIAKGTIEEKIVEMQEAKRDLAESVLGGEGARSTALTRDDVLALLEL